MAPFILAAFSNGPVLSAAIREPSWGTLLADRPLFALAALFGAGVLTSLTPCIYPMIPITASVVASSAREGAGRGRILLLTLLYVLGLALFYALLGLIAGLTGTLFGTVSANPWVLIGMGNLLLLFALVLFDILPMPIPRRLLQWAGTRRGGSPGGIFLLGAASGIVAAPCGAPAFAAVLTWVAASRAGMMGFLYLFVFSLGMSSLLIAVGLSSGTLARLPRSGRWMVGIKRGAGVILLLVAEYYFVKAGYGL